jgi:kynureninase
VRQTARLIELAREADFGVNSPKNPAERGGTVVIDVADGAEVTRELVRRNFLVDHRPGSGIRVAPHFYSTDEELDLTIREMRAVASERAPAAPAR